MAGNSTFLLVTERGWRRGLGNSLRNELERWWKTRMWWVQSLIWVSIIGILLGAILFSSNTPPAIDEVAMLFSIFIGLFPAVGVVIIMQGALVGEKRDGTATWVLSKPVTRTAFILAKAIAGSIGVAATMVIVPGLAAYALSALATHRSWALPGFLAGMSVIFLVDFFFLSLTLMLGSFFSSRGPVIGIALGLLFLEQYMVQLVPQLRFVLPWNLIVPMGQMDAAVPCLIIGLKNFSPITIAVVAIESIVFIGIAFLRFSREEF